MAPLLSSAAMVEEGGGGGSSSVTSLTPDYLVSCQLQASLFQIKLGIFLVIYLGISTKYSILTTKLKKRPFMRSVEMVSL